MKRKPFSVLVSAGLLAAACSSKVNPPPAVEDLITDLSVLPSQVSVPQGLTVALTVRVVRSTALNDPLTVTVSGLPDGVLASPISFTGNTGTLNLYAAPTAPLTSGVAATVIGSNGRNSMTTPLIVNVTATGFTLSLVPTQVNVSRGSSHSVTVHVNRQNFSGVIEVTVSGLPPEVTAEPLSISANLGSLLFRATRTAEVGSFALAVSAISGLMRVTVPLVLAVNPPGAVDPDFGVGSSVPGLVVTPLHVGDGGTSSAVVGVALQPDGKIVVVGNRQRSTLGVGTPCFSGCNAVAVARYDTHGTLDPTFVGSATPDGGVPPPLGAVVVLEGRIVTNPPGATAVAISDAGILVASGGTTNNPDTLLRFTPDGTLDPTFNADGGRLGRAQRTINASSVAVVAEEKILVAGTTYPPPTQASFALARYNSDGTLDVTFGDGGILAKQLTGTTGSPAVTSAAFAGEKAFLVGSVSFGVPLRQGVAVVGFDLSDGGSVDTSFNDGGQVLFQLGGFSSSGQTALALQENVVVTAITRASSLNNADIAAIRLQPDGGLDSSFGANGIARTSFARDGGMVNSAAVPAAAISGDRIVVAGNFRATTSGGTIFLVVRYNIDGSPDVAFGPDGSGIAIDIPTSTNGVFNAIAFQVLDGKMIAVGNVDLSPNSSQFAVVRYLP